MLENSQIKGLPLAARNFHEVASIYINPVGHLSPWTQIITLRSELRHTLYFCFTIATYWKVSCNVHGDPLVEK